jgi:hypothetical protein
LNQKIAHWQDLDCSNWFIRRSFEMRRRASSLESNFGTTAERSRVCVAPAFVRSIAILAIGRRHRAADSLDHMPARHRENAGAIAPVRLDNNLQSP